MQMTRKQAIDFVLEHMPDLLVEDVRDHPTDPLTCVFCHSPQGEENPADPANHEPWCPAMCALKALRAQK